jgi:hypothetical protein
MLGITKAVLHQSFTIVVTLQILILLTVKNHCGRNGRPCGHFKIQTNQLTVVHNNFLLAFMFIINYDQATTLILYATPSRLTLSRLLENCQIATVYARFIP